MFLWDLTVDSEPVELKQPLNSQFTSSQPTCSVVRDHVAAVGTADGKWCFVLNCIVTPHICLLFHVLFLLLTISVKVF